MIASSDDANIEIAKKVRSFFILYILYFRSEKATSVSDNTCGNWLIDWT